MTGTTFWQAIFGNDNAVTIEIGPGRGEFLLEAARANPHRNFYGIEHSRRRAAETLRRIDVLGLPNARVLLADATCVIGLLPDACVESYIVLFPDPWWKRRHHRRRLFTETLVDLLVRTLVPGGTVHLVTDVEDYFQIAQGLLQSHCELQSLPFELSWPGERTSFARKARARNAPIFASTHQRRSDRPQQGSRGDMVIPDAALLKPEVEGP
jgi:tRNA (guanine-N7-)-methyltransferase